MNLTKIVSATLLLMLCFACQKEMSFENSLNSITSQWEFKEAGSSFKGAIDTAYYEDVFGIPSLVLEGTSDDTQGQIVIQLFSSTTIATGTYKTPLVFFDYYVNGSSAYSNDIAAIDKFSLTIDKIDSLSVSGTFSGEVKDPQGNVKTITDGKFTARFKKQDTPGGGTTSGCRISNIAYYDITSGGALAALTSYYNTSNKVSKIQLIDSTGPSVDMEFNLTYPSSKIQLDAKQYFTLQADGKVKEFHGYLEPTDNTSPEVIMTYTYNASGYLIKSTVALPVAPAIPALTSTYEWVNGNLTRATMQPAGVLAKTTIEYEYDLAANAINFISLFPSSELIIFQSAIDYGKSSSNLVKKSTIKDYDNAGTVTGTSISAFSNYIMGGNQQVAGFTITGDPSVYASDVKYVLSYKCQ